jgi:hypothetical protein
MMRVEDMPRIAHARTAPRLLRLKGHANITAANRRGSGERTASLGICTQAAEVRRFIMGLSGLSGYEHGLPRASRSEVLRYCLNETVPGRDGEDSALNARRQSPLHRAVVDVANTETSRVRYLCS